MTLKSLFAMAGLTAAIGLSLIVPSAAEAQGGRRGARNGAQGGFGAGAQGAFGNPMQMMMGGGNVIDPARSAKATLIYRPEVQNALALDLKQKNALDALKDVQAQNQQKMGQDMRTLFQGMRGQAGQTTTPEERQQKMQEITGKAKGFAQGYLDDLDKRIDDILTPRQRKRLNELDLRWRGPLSLVDPKVADQATLGADDKQKAQDAYKEFTDARQKLMASMLPAGMRARFSGAAGATGAAADVTTPPAVPTPPTVVLTPEEQQAAQKKALRDFEKGRVAMGTKLVAAVTPVAASNWKVMTGAPFTFRDDE